MAKKTKKTQTVDKNKRKKILLGVLIPTGVLAVTAAVVPPCVIMCARTTTEEGIQTDKDNWVKAMKYVYDLDVSSNYTCNGSNDGSKQFTLKVDGDNQFCHSDSSQPVENVYFKKVDNQYKKYDVNNPGWVDVSSDLTPKHEIFSQVFSYLENLYDDCTFKDGIYTYTQQASAAETYQIDVKLIKVDGETRVKTFNMFVVETKQTKGNFTFSDFGKTKIELPK